MNDRVKIVAVAGLTGWAVLIAAEALYYFLFPHAPGFASELGVPRAFVFFSLYYSVIYVPIFCATLMLYVKARSGLLLSALIGGVMFALLEPLATKILLHPRSWHLNWISAIWFLAGLVAFGALRSCSWSRNLTR